MLALLSMQHWLLFAGFGPLLASLLESAEPSHENPIIQIVKTG
jgi:hypothetical protein